MKFIDLLPNLKKTIVFSVQDLKILDSNYDTSKTKRWVEKWYLIPVIRWYYTLGEYTNYPMISSHIANSIYKPSYISLETVLHRYGIIPEYPFTITSISTKKTKKFDTDFWNYSYNTVKPDLFWWYDIQKNWKEKILIADLEKAIVDFLYLRKQYKDIQDFRWLRWNRQELKNKLDKNKLDTYAKLVGSPTIIKKINILTDYINQW